MFATLIKRIFKLAPLSTPGNSPLYKGGVATASADGVVLGLGQVP